MISSPEPTTEQSGDDRDLVGRKVAEILLEPSKAEIDEDIAISKELDPETKEKIAEEIKKRKTVFDSDAVCGPG